MGLLESSRLWGAVEKLMDDPLFLTFHAAPKSSDGAGPHPSANLAHRQYMSMIEHLFRSVRLFHGGAKFGVLTSPETDLSGLKMPFKRVDNDLDTSRMMLERTLCQARFVETFGFESPLILLDSDMLLNRDISDILSQDFDVAVTWRKSNNMPINGGLIILNNKRPEIVRAFFSRFVKIYLDRYADENAKWYGDQLALKDCIGLDHRQMAKSPMQTIDGCKILFLPCDIFNFSPDNSENAIAVRDPRIAVMHFKGERKHLMDLYWHKHLRPIVPRVILRRLVKSIIPKWLAR